MSRLLLHTIWRPIGRARRSRGFGVHSPFAFRFITFVLRDRRSTYYATPRIRTIARNRADRRRLTRLFRIICDRAPGIAIIPDSVSDTARRIITLADSRLPIVTPAYFDCDKRFIDRPLLYYPAPTDSDLDFIRSFIFTGIATVIIDRITPARLATLTRNADSLMTFTNGTSAILIRQSGLPTQTFDLNF